MALSSCSKSSKKKDSSSVATSEVVSSEATKATSEATSTEEVVVNHVEAKDATCEEDGTISETIIANMRRDGVEVSSVDANLEYEILLRGVTAEVGMIIYQ